AGPADPAAAVNRVPLVNLGCGSRFCGRTGVGRPGGHPVPPWDLRRWRTLLLRAALGAEAPPGTRAAAASAGGRAMSIPRLRRSKGGLTRGEGGSGYGGWG